jgi:hypothetical protein
LNALHRGSRAIATGARLPVDWRNGSMQAALGIDVRPIGLGQMPAFQGGRGVVRTSSVRDTGCYCARLAPGVFWASPERAAATNDPAINLPRVRAASSARIRSP